MTGLFYPESCFQDKYKRFQKDAFETACDGAIEALEAVNRLSTKRRYSDEHLAEQIYTELDDKWYFIYNTQVIIGSLKRKKEQLLRIANNPELFSGDFLSLHDILVDVSTFLMCYAKWKEIDTDFWPAAYMRKRISAFEVFSSGLYISKRKAHIDDFAIPPLSIFLLRQAIELRIREILNINVLVNEKNQVIKITSDKFLPVLSENEVILPVKKHIIEKIHQWANEYVHLGNFDFFWKVEFAQFYLMDFFAPTNNAIALKSYFDDTLQADILGAVSGPARIVPLSSDPKCVELLDKDRFNEVQSNVRKMGYSKYKAKIEQEFFVKLNRRAAPESPDS